MINENKVIEIINSNAELTKIIIDNYNKINVFFNQPVTSDFVKFNYIHLLQAIAIQESTYGRNNKPRFEPAYGPGGLYYKTAHVKNLYEKYGKDSACSWSSFQIMFITAFELGYRGKPSELQDDSIAIEWVIKYIEKRILKFNPTNLSQIFDAYNSGSFKDKYIPKEYIESCNYYYSIIEKNFPITEISIVDTIKPKTFTYIVTDEQLTMFIKEVQHLKDRLIQLELSLLMIKG